MPLLPTQTYLESWSSFVKQTRRSIAKELVFVQEDTMYVLRDVVNVEQLHVYLDGYWMKYLVRLSTASFSVSSCKYIFGKRRVTFVISFTMSGTTGP